MALLPLRYTVSLVLSYLFMLYAFRYITNDPSRRINFVYLRNRKWVKVVPSVTCVGVRLSYPYLLIVIDLKELTLTGFSFPGFQ